MTRLVFVSTDTLGDLLLREPVFRLARRHGREVTLVVRESFAEAAAHVAPGATLLTTTANPYGADDLESEAERVAALIRAQNPAEVVCLLKSPNRFDTALFSRLTGITRRGFEAAPAPRLSVSARPANEAPSPPFDIRLPVSMDDAERHAYAALARHLGWPEDETSLRPVLPPRVSEPSLDSLAIPGLSAGTYVVCCPEGTQNVRIKSWPKSTLFETVRHLGARHGLACVFVGVPAEEHALREAAAVCGATVWIGGAGKWDELCALMRAARAYVGTDTGPMHLAAAVGIPVFGLFGGGTWGRFLPAANRSVVVTEKLPCFHCGWDCLLESPRCLTDIPWERIRAGVDLLLEKPDTPERLILDGGEGKPGAFALAERLSRQLTESEADRAARLAAMRTLGAQLAESEADRAARLEVIRQLEHRLAESEADRAARLAAMESLGARLAESEGDRAARLEVIRALERRLAEADANLANQRRATTEQLAELESRLTSLCRETEAAQARAAAAETAAREQRLAWEKQPYALLRRLDRRLKPQP